MIPVEKPPAAYTSPRPVSGGARRDPFDTMLAGAPPGARVYRARVGWRGCLVAIAIAAAFLFSVGGLGTCALSDVVMVDAPTNVVTSLRTTARAQGREAAFEQDLDRLSALITSRRLGFMGAGVLLNRFSDAKADTQITEAELDHLMALVHDIVVGDGEIDPAAYPNGR